MPAKVPLDYHIHSNFSSDSEASLEELCLSALQKDIPEIGLSEHFDLHPKDSARGFYRPEEWWLEFKRVRRELDGRLTLRAGIEIGEPHRFPEAVRSIQDRYPYDYVIGSLHFVGDDFMFDQSLLRKKSEQEILGAYFLELERMTRNPQFDILGHLDLPVRNAKTIWGGYDPRRYEDLIRPVLHNCIEHNLALDINAGGLRKPARNLMPDPLILGWYAEMGGERVTLGSDAHAPDHVGLYLDQALEAIRVAGIKSITHFERRQARLLPLE